MMINPNLLKIERVNKKPITLKDRWQLKNRTGMKHAENEILELFVNKASDLLVVWESNCLDLEKDASITIFNELFRITHSLKGFGMNAGLKELSSFVHMIEEVVLAMKESKDQVSQEDADLLLDCKDQLQTWVDEIRYDSKHIENTEDLEARMAKKISQFGQNTETLSTSKNKFKQLILLLDLETTYTRNLKNLLEFNFEVVHCTSNLSVNKVLRYRQPDLVITELRAKEIDGLALIKAVKDNPNVKIIAYSQLFHDQLMKAKNMGAHIALRKSSDIIEVATAVETLLKA